MESLRRVGSAVTVVVALGVGGCCNRPPPAAQQRPDLEFGWYLAAAAAEECDEEKDPPFCLYISIMHYGKEPIPYERIYAIGVSRDSDDQPKELKAETAVQEGTQAEERPLLPGEFRTYKVGAFDCRFPLEVQIHAKGGKVLKPAGADRRRLIEMSKGGLVQCAKPPAHPSR